MNINCCYLEANVEKESDALYFRDTGVKLIVMKH